ncbi:apolipoprotein C-I [Epinephelus lanceolatus]|uniref:apolipoprotein C-I n=1 Tax=Epinephelus lanceolatus TaxID=310571 RepID=UPI00144786D9|nr:apolipoprotein C-I [Epinephelus lanceolatus]
MRLYLAIAVLMLALVAYTEAQEETLEQKLAKFTEQVSQVGQNLGEKIKTGFDDFQTSDFAVNSQARFNEWVEWVKTRVQELSR